MKKSLALSLVFHLLLLAGVLGWRTYLTPRSHPEYFFEGELASSPAITSTSRKKTTNAIASRTETPAQPTVGDLATTATAPISLDSAAGAIAGPAVAENLRQKIAQNLHYPRALQARGVSGDVRARFTIDADGQASHIEIIGEPPSELSRLVRKAVSEAAPYARDYQNLTYVLTFEFTLR